MEKFNTAAQKTAAQKFPSRTFPSPASPSLALHRSRTHHVPARDHHLDREERSYLLTAGITDELE